MRVFAYFSLSLAVALGFANWRHGDPETTHPSKAERPGADVNTGSSGKPSLLAAAQALDAALDQEGQRRVDEYLGALATTERAVDAYLSALAETAERERQAAAAAAAADAAAMEAARRPPSTTAPPSGARSTTGACVGFAVPDYIIQRESGGNPSAYNPSSGAYGCAQTLLSHYNAGGVCAGLDPYSVDGQRACTQRLVDRAGLTPWSTR